MSNARRIGLGLIAIAAVAVWFLMAPDDPETIDPFDPTSRTYNTLIQTALDDAEANEDRAETAPQQQVVNGWVNRDLLTIIAYQNVDLLDGVGALGDQTAATSASGLAVRDDRVPALVVLLVFAVAWLGIMTPDVRPSLESISVESKAGDNEATDEEGD